MISLLTVFPFFRPLIEVELWATYMSRAYSILLFILVSMIIIYELLPYKRHAEQKKFWIVNLCAFIASLIHSVLWGILIDGSIDAGNDKLFFAADLLGLSVAAQIVVFYIHSYFFAKNRKYFCRYHEYLKKQK